MGTELDRAYDHCQMVARQQARNFYYAFRTLPIDKRRAIYAAYAVCRLWDDIADGDSPIELKRHKLAETRDALARALSDPQSAESAEEFGKWIPPELLAAVDAARSFQIPPRYFMEILDGVESDLVKTRYTNFGELREYCYRVASAVGLICIKIFGYDDPRATEYAIDMGIALQLTNILRDIKEDAGRDRIYIPQDELAEFGYTEYDLKRGAVDARFTSLMTFQVERARSYYERSRPLFDLIEPESQTCIRVLHAAYAAILDRIEQSEFDVFSRRIGLSAGQKLLITARLWLGSAVPGSSVFRRLL